MKTRTKLPVLNETPLRRSMEKIVYHAYPVYVEDFSRMRRKRFYKQGKPFNQEIALELSNIISNYILILLNNL